MSHYISSITIKNYKSIKEQTFELAQFTPLVGYNNAGKTNIITALIWLLKKSTLPIECFYNTKEPVELIGVIEGINDNVLSALASNHQKNIKKYISEERLVIKRTQYQPGDSTSKIKLEVKEVAEDAKKEWADNPTGIDNAVKALFPEPIHIGAMEDAQEDVAKNKSSTTIGKLLSEIIEPLEEKYGQNIKDTLKGLGNLLDADGEERAQELNNFDKSVNEKIEDFFPGIKLKLHVPTPELKEIFTKSTIKVYEDDNSGRDISSLGHGAQRSIQMALIRHLAEAKKNENASTNTLLLIDEPELYLHPQAIEVIRVALKKLSTIGYQVVFSTHSASMISSKDIGNVLLIRKDYSLGTHKRKTLKAAVEEVEVNAKSQFKRLFTLGNASNILFSERVILTEGKTELRVFPIIFECITGRTFGAAKLALIQQGGSGNTKNSLRVLKAIDLPAKAIVDLDYAFKQAIVDSYLEEDDADVMLCKKKLNEIAEAEGISLGDDGWPKKSGVINAQNAFALLASLEDCKKSINAIHGKLKEHNIWLWQKGTIERYLNIKSKDEDGWAQFVDDLNTNPDTLEVIPELEEMKNCIGWLNSISTEAAP